MAPDTDSALARNMTHYFERFQSMTSKSKTKVVRSAKLKKFIHELVKHDHVFMKKILDGGLKQHRIVQKQALAEAKEKEKGKRRQLNPPDKSPTGKRAKVANPYTHSASRTLKNEQNLTQHLALSGTKKADGSLVESEEDHVDSLPPPPPYESIQHQGDLMTTSVKVAAKERCSNAGGFHGCKTAGDWQRLASTASTNDKYRVELGIIRATPSVISSLKNYCLTLSRHRLRLAHKREHEWQSVLNTCASLDFDRTKSVLLEYLRDRIKVPGGRMIMPSTWSMTSPDEIFGALQSMQFNTIDAKIHRIYGQIKFFDSVEESCSISRRQKARKATHNHVAPHLVILEERANKYAGEVTEKEKQKISNSYHYEYFTGQKWSQVVKWFGGHGIVLAFVCAEIGSWHITRSWSDFQRRCLQYLAQYLQSTKDLVEAMGNDALDRYCRYGFLDEATVEKIESVAGYLILDDDSDESASEDSDGGKNGNASKSEIESKGKSSVSKDNNEGSENDDEGTGTDNEGREDEDEDSQEDDGASEDEYKGTEVDELLSDEDSGGADSE